MSKQVKVLLIRENTLQSWSQDLFTFASIVGSFWFNYKFIGNNHTLDILLFITFFMLAMGRAGNYRKAKEIYDDAEEPSNDKPAR